MDQRIAPVPIGRLTTPAELAVRGWGGDMPYYDAALACPECQTVLEKVTIEPRSGESRAEAVQRTLFGEHFDETIGAIDQERYCADCDIALYRETLIVYNFRTAKEGDEPYYPYYMYDLPITTYWDPGKYIALLLIKSLHQAADWHSEPRFISPEISMKITRRCPLCRTAASSYEDLDYHHWSYDPDIGVALCRDCHTTIHRDQRAREQAALSSTGDWRDVALAELVRQHRRHRSVNNPAMAAGFEEIAVRYNIPYAPDRIERTYDREFRDCDHTIVRDARCDPCMALLSNPYNPNADPTDQP